jgi:hypothetical protein
MDNFSYYTRVNKTIDVDYVDELKVFQIGCFDIGGSEIPELLFFGIPILEWRLWLLFFILGAFIWLIVKLGSRR